MTEKPKRPRKTTRTGKPLDKKTGKIVAPKKGTIISAGDGKVRQATDEDVKAARTTVLPTVGPKKETRRDAPMAIRGARPVTKGFSVAYPRVEAAVHAAMTHLGNMRATHGTDDFHQHHEAFNLIHANIGKMSPELHTTLGQARHEIMHPSEQTDGKLALIHKAVTARLAIGKDAAQGNLERSGKGEDK